MRFATVILLGLAAGCDKQSAGVGQPGAQEESLALPRSDQQRVQGVWKIARVDWPPGDTMFRPGPDLIDKARITIEDDRATLVVNEGHPVYLIFTSSPGKPHNEVNLLVTDGKDSREPRRYPLSGSKGSKDDGIETSQMLRSIYKLDGETLVLALPTDSGIARPTQFEPAMVRTGDTLSLKAPVVVIELHKMK